MACQLKKDDRLAKPSLDCELGAVGGEMSPLQYDLQEDDEVVGGLEMSGVEEMLGAVGGAGVEVGAGDAPCAEEEFVRGISRLNVEAE